jgi:TPR repeat protein
MSFNKLIVTLFFAGLMAGQQMYVTAASSAPQSASASSRSVSTDAKASDAKKTEVTHSSWAEDLEDLYEDNYVAPTPISLAHAGGTEPKTERATTPILKPKDVPPTPAEEKFSLLTDHEESVYYHSANREELRKAEALFRKSRLQVTAFTEFKGTLTDRALYGNVQAAYQLGTMFIQEGKAATPSDLLQGMSWFEMAATSGHAPSCKELVKCYQNSASLLANRTPDECVAEAKKWAAIATEYEAKASAAKKRSADTGATVRTAIIDSSSSSPSSASASSMPHNPFLDLKTLRVNAINGNPLAQLTLGKHFLLQGDWESGCTWLTLSAQQKNIDAHCWLCFYNLRLARTATHQKEYQKDARISFANATALCKSAPVACEKMSAIYQINNTQTYDRESALAWQKMAEFHRTIIELPDIIKSADEDGQTILARRQERLLAITKENLAALEHQFFGTVISSETTTVRPPSSARTATAEDDKRALKAAKTRDKKKRQEERKKERNQKAQEENAKKEAAIKAALEEQQQKAVKAAQAMFDELQKTATQEAVTVDTAEAQHKISQLYQKGNEAITSDEKQALTWLQTACRTAQAVAQQRITPYETALQKVVLAAIGNNMRVTVLDVDNDSNIQSALANAQLYLAIKYEHGIGGVTKNAVRAAELYQQAAKTSDFANTWYALRHYRAISAETKMASEWYAKAPRQTNPLALYDQAQLCHLDDKNPRSLELAFTLYQEVAKRSYEKECKQMAEAYDEIPTMVSLAKTLCSIDDYEAAKKIGYIPAWYSLGKALETSRPDQALAAQLIASRYGNPKAQHQLALWHEKGNARPYIARNKSTAFAWCLLAAEQGLPEAEYQLGNYYLNGDGISAAPAQAVQWYTRAAPHNPNAAYELGCRYERGTGVAAVDLKQAVGFYTSAAEHGHVEAMNKLVTYYRGTGANATRAERWQLCIQAATKKRANEKKEAELDGKDEKKTSLAKTATDDKDEEKEESANVEELSGKEKRGLTSTLCIAIDENFKEALGSDGLRRNKATVLQHISDFSMDPLNNTLDIKKLKGFANVLRIRSGDYRIFIIMQVIGDMVIYHIDTIVPRGDAYKQQVLARIESKALELNKKS